MSTSTVAVYIDAGSRADKMTASGAAHFLEVSWDFVSLGGNGWEWQGARDVAWEMQLEAKTEESTRSVWFLLK